ncbi:hypothetical protein [Streptomyces sp. YGL11-2]|uniref:hypothetical protein n=1 Tax=Streptomyces sp. YGL11-2 TaxID=3414028 RepID=UPI003CF1B31B
MTTPVTTPAHKAPRRTGRRAAVLAASVALIAAPMLAGTATPAMAEDGNTFYTSEQEVIDLLTKSSPLYAHEAIQGYPVTGQDTKRITLEEVKKVYTPDQAVTDAQKWLTGFDSTSGFENFGTEERTSSTEDKDQWLGNWDAKTMCGKPSDELARQNRKLTCGFVGKLDTEYPTMQATSKTTGKAKLTYTTQASVSREDNTTSGWSAGGKITLTATPENQGGSAEGSFTYNQSTSTTNKWATMAEERREIDIPDKTTGWLEARANGGWYTGYILQKIDDTDGKAQKIVAIPARVLIQAPKDSAPITWVKRQS